jgi:hypothetical protein
MRIPVSQFIDEIRKISSLSPEEASLGTNGIKTKIKASKVILEKVTGIKSAQIPLLEGISKKEATLISIELEEMLSLFNLFFGFPKKLPGHLRYGFFYQNWGKEIFLSENDSSYLEICNYNIDQCPFPCYCKICEEISERIKMDEHLQRGGFEEVDEIS